MIQLHDERRTRPNNKVMLENLGWILTHCVERPIIRAHWSLIGSRFNLLNCSTPHRWRTQGVCAAFLMTYRRTGCVQLSFSYACHIFCMSVDEGVIIRDPSSYDCKQSNGMQTRALPNLDKKYCKYFSALSNCQSKGWLTIYVTPSRRS